MIGKDAFQEVDITGITRPAVSITFWSEKSMTWAGL
jgi:thiamine pyrophosphate-dependent acetolactate synthase large subunit-like protein